MNRTSSLILPLAAGTVLALGVASFGRADKIFESGGVAIHGYDPVAYFKQNKAVEGTRGLSAQHKEATFLFSSPENLATFLKDPERYVPQYGGYCAYGVARGYKASTQPEAFTIVDDKLYLNFDMQVMATWRADTQSYIAKSDANWEDVRLHPVPE